MPKMFFSLHFVVMIVAVVHGASNAKGCVEYRGEQQSSSTGQTCLNWINTTRDYDIKSHADSETGVGDHNYCRNPDVSVQPWCYVTGPEGEVQRQSCAIDDCKDQAAPTMTAKADTLPAVPTNPQTKSSEPAKPAPAQKESAAVQTIMGISQRVHTKPKQKKDLGTMGDVLGILMMAIIILLGVGITFGYFYKRGQNLKKQHEQRVYEREMQRITLPLSAFANPTCDLVDENTVVIVAGEPTPAGEGTEEEGGGGPLMGQQAGTPGA